MKTKKVFVCLGVLILGSVVTVAIDHLIGVSLKDVGVVVRLTHRTTYMLLGGVLFSMIEWLYN